MIITPIPIPILIEILGDWEELIGGGGSRSPIHRVIQIGFALKTSEHYTLREFKNPAYPRRAL
ncbi:MAG: hypothetical protein ABGX04_16230 [Myxococcales bacterium]|nr:hypothetical protein [Myxococcales bacterium]HIK84201.1 hypothetical protein [Myxococcales bacterium]